MISTKKLSGLVGVLTAGPVALPIPATVTATPLMVPNNLSEGALLVSRMVEQGNAKVTPVHLENNKK
jgi:hypothetical protein